VVKRPSLWNDVRGAAAAEYALLLGLVGVTIVLAVINLSNNIACSINESANVVGDVSSGSGHSYGHSHPPGNAYGHRRGC